MSDQLKPCPKCKGTKHSWRHTQSGAYDFVRHVHEIRCGTTSCWSDVYATGSTREEAVANWNAGKLMFTTDERSYRAGIEAAIAWFTSDDASTGDHMVDMHYRELANELRALPIPPQAALNPRG
jgi:hypothetical protein